jgi:uncharacterized protein
MRPRTLIWILVAFAVIVPSVAVLAILRDPRPQRALSAACWSGDILKARVALFLGADIDSHPGGSLPNIVGAGWGGHVEMIEFLLSRGADIETTDKFGGTALSRAAQNSRLSAVELLLSRGANPNVKDKEGGNTPEALARMSFDRVLDALAKHRNAAGTK